MRPFFAVAAAVLAVAVGCGGDDRNAGLTAEQAEREAIAALEAARRDGTLPPVLSPEPSAEEAMGRAGGSALGAAEQQLVPVGPAVRVPAPPDRTPAWVVEFRPEGAYRNVWICVYVWKGGSEIARC